MLTRPEYDWEKVRHPVHEGPYVIKKNNRIKRVHWNKAGTPNLKMSYEEK